MSFLKRNFKTIAAITTLWVFGLSLWLGTAEPVVPTGSWGLSFEQEGKPPQGNASSDALLQYDGRYLGNPQEPVIYLTFDAGFENGLTPKILDTLKAHNVSAAFFLVGTYFESHPDLVRRMVDDGHTVGNHTYHHYDMSKIGDFVTFSKELEVTAEKYEEVIGSPMPKFYRPPQGIYSEENLKMAQELGYNTVFWSLAYVDWYQDDQPTHEEAFAKLIPRIHNGAVVLLHSTSQTNADILDELLTKWKDLGYSFGSLDDLFATKPVGLFDISVLSV